MQPKAILCVPQRGKENAQAITSYPVPLRLWRRTYPVPLRLWRRTYPVPQRGIGVQVHRGNRGKEDAQATTPMPFLSFAPVPLYRLGNELKRSTCIGVCTSNKIQRRKFIGSPKATTVGSFAFFCQRQFIGDHLFSSTKFIQVVHLLYPFRLHRR